jgi:lysophospholipase L1-like esterase
MKKFMIKKVYLFLPVLLSLLLVLGFLGFKSGFFTNSSRGSQVSKLRNKKVLFLGDSLTNLEKVNYDEAIKNPTKPNRKKYYKYIDWVRKLTGAQCYNYGYSGSSIARITSPEDPDTSSFISRYKDIIRKYPDPNSFDFIIIFGGVNDYMQNAPVSFFDNTDPYSFYGALKTVVNDFRTTYPNAKIILMNPLISSRDGKNFDLTPNSSNYILQDYRKAIEEVARTLGTAHFPTEHMSGLNANEEAILKKFYSGIGDGVHPLPSGHKKIAVPLINFMESLVY